MGLRITKIMTVFVSVLQFVQAEKWADVARVWI